MNELNREEIDQQKLEKLKQIEKEVEQIETEIKQEFDNQKLKQLIELKQSQELELIEKDPQRFVRRKLIKIIEEKPNIIYDVRLLKGGLRDFCYDKCSQERNILIDALEDKVIFNIQNKIQKGNLKATALPQGIEELRQKRYYTPKEPKWAIETWALALGIVTEDELPLPDPPSKRDEPVVQFKHKKKSFVWKWIWANFIGIVVALIVAMGIRLVWKNVDFNHPKNLIMFFFYLPMYFALIGQIYVLRKKEAQKWLKFSYLSSGIGIINIIVVKSLIREFPSIFQYKNILTDEVTLIIGVFLNSLCLGYGQWLIIKEKKYIKKSYARLWIFVYPSLFLLLILFKKILLR